MASTAGAGTEPQLLPDLVTVKVSQGDLAVRHSGGKLLLPGQDLNVTGLGRGRYCLVSSADPDNLLRESNNSNNARKTRIALHPAKRSVKRLSGHCGR